MNFLRLLLCILCALASLHAEAPTTTSFNQKVIQLFELLGMPAPSENRLDEPNRWAQQHLLRQGERWQQQTGRYEELKPCIKPLLRDLGLVDGVSAPFKNYKGAIVHGALLSSVRLRLHYLVEQWNQGVRFRHLYFLSGERPLDPLYELDCGLLSKTESEMVRFVWEQSEIPEEMRKEVQVHFVNAPAKYDASTGQMLRPNTNDTVLEWLKSNPPQGRYLAVTNAPYIKRQDVVIKALAPKTYSFDTIGPGASEQEEMAIFLDELARLIFQLTKQEN